MSNDYITLVGAEEVTRAANRMTSAADTMSQAASSIDHTLEMFLRRYEELIGREMRIKEVHQVVGGITYALPITEAHSTADGVVITVGYRNG